MTSLLTALNSFSFTGATTRPQSDTSEAEYQSVFAATAVLLAGGIGLILIALAQV